MDTKTQARRLLDWYDAEKRDLPWRRDTDPYHVWLSEIMLQQTTVPAVVPYYLKFLAAFPRLADLAAAPVDDIMRLWAGLGYYSRARNLHACANQVMARHDGVFPQDEKALLALSGIGGYTASAIRAIAFDIPAVPLDANLERVGARLYVIDEPLPAAKPAIRDALAPLFTARPGDVAQALMDLATGICTVKNPKCTTCPLAKGCKARAQGNADTLPIKMPKPEKPHREGFVYWIENDGDVWLERRADKGLLGGMLGLPTSDWGDAPTHPAHIKNVRDTGAVVQHTFTHFTLRLRVMTAHLKTTPSTYVLAPCGDALDAGLPTVFKKAVKLFVTHEKNHG